MTEGDIANALAGEMAFATDLCDVCVVDDERAVPAEMAEMTEVALSNP